MKSSLQHLLALLGSVLVVACSVSCLDNPNTGKAPTPPIQTEITHRSSPSNETDVDFSVRWQRVTYDRHGHVLETDWDYPTEDRDTFAFEYDERGNIIKSNWYASDGSPEGINTFGYDYCSNVVEIVTSPSADWIWYTGGRTVIEYDIQGNVAKESTYTPDNDLIGFTVYIYNGSNNLNERISYDFEGAPTSRTVHKYDSEGNRIETASYDSNGQLTWKRVNVYDDHGNPIESRGYQPDGSLAGKATYEYDSEGNVIKQTEYGSLDDYSFGATITITYLEFDEYGNWTKRAASGTSRTDENGEVQEENGEYAEYRTITYYEGAANCKKGTISSITPTPQPTPTATTTPIPEFKAYVIYEADLSQADNPVTAMKGIIAVLENRLTAYGIAEPQVTQIGMNHLKVSLTGINGDDMEEAAALLGEPALIKFKEQVADDNGNVIWEPATGKLKVWDGEKDVEVEKELTSQYFKGKIEISIPQGGPVILFNWNDDGAKLFEQITRRLINKPLGIFLGDQLISAPTVRSVITDSGQIEGMELDQARHIAKLLNAGRLDVPLRIVEKSGF